MTNSFSRVPPLSNEQIDKYAHRTRGFYNQDKFSFFDVLSCLQSGKVPTTRGVKRLNYIVRPNGSLGTDEALTRHETEVVTVETTERIHDAALFGEGRSRFTLCHELGHAILHDGIAMPRSSLKLVKPKWIENYRSAEHQADRFSASALVYKPFLRSNLSIDEIAIEFGVSQSVAKIAFEETERSCSRLEAADRVRRIAETFHKKHETKKANTFLDCQCPQCGLQKLIPIAGKYMCDNCNIIHDALQDGDST